MCLSHFSRTKTPKRLYAVVKILASTPASKNIDKTGSNEILQKREHKQTIQEIQHYEKKKSSCFIWCKKLSMS